MTIQEGTLGEVETAIRPDKKKEIDCKQVQSRHIKAVFPATVLLVTRTHIHLSNWLAAFEFDYIPRLEGALQEGVSYVFRATWISEAYRVNNSYIALSLEQIFDPDVERYHFHPLCLSSYGKDRHRWNGHHGRLEIICGTTAEAAGEKMARLQGETSRLVKPKGTFAGTRDLPRGCYFWKERLA
jgi:hypothetical protein